MTTTAVEIEEVSPVTEKVDAPPSKNNTQMMLVEIDCRVAMQPIPGGHVARQGVFRYRLYKGWLPVLLRQVRTDEDRAEYERCTRLYEQELNRYLEENAGSLTGLERDLKLQELRDTYPQSPEAFFARDNLGKSLPPFERVTVIEDNLPAPVDEAAIQRAKETAELVKTVVGQPNGAADVATAVAAAIKQLVAEGVLTVNGNQQKK